MKDSVGPNTCGRVISIMLLTLAWIRWLLATTVVHYRNSLVTVHCYDKGNECIWKARGTLRNLLQLFEFWTVCLPKQSNTDNWRRNLLAVCIIILDMTSWIALPRPFREWLSFPNRACFDQLGMTLPKAYLELWSKQYLRIFEILLSSTGGRHSRTPRRAIHWFN